FITIWLFMLTIILLGMRDNIGQFIFWPTGGLVYIFSYSVFFATIYVLNRNDVLSFIIIFLVFISSLLLETINPALFVFLIYSFRSKEPIIKKLALLAVFLLGSGILILAPGNFARADSSGGITLNPVTLFWNLQYLLYKSL